MNASTEAAKVNQSDTLDKGVRIGLVAYGVTHLIIAATALPLAWGGRTDNAASQKGAFAQLAEHPVGRISLFVVALGLFSLVVWQGIEAAIGHREEDGGKRIFKRVASGVKAVVYAVLGWSALTVAMGSGGGGSSTDSRTARLMSAPFGVFLVGCVGLGIVSVGGYLVYKGWAEKFTKRLDARATSGDRRTPIVLLGKIGYISKGVALATIGVLFLVAAVRHQPKKSGGLDVALHELLRQPFGAVLLTAVALGLGCFGLYCFAWARHLRR